MELLLNTVRMVDRDQLREYSIGDNNSLRDSLAIAIINPEDFNNLGITSNLNLRLTNQFGSVIVKLKQDKNVPVGSILMPVSIWSNQITGIEKDELVYKNIKVAVEATKDTVLNFDDILILIKGD